MRVGRRSKRVLFEDVVMPVLWVLAGYAIGTGVGLVVLYETEGTHPTKEYSTGQNEYFTHQDHELRCRSKYNPNWGPCWRL